MTKVIRQGYGLRTFVFAAAWLIGVAIAVQAWAQPKIVIQGDETKHAGEFVVDRSNPRDDRRRVSTFGPCWSLLVPAPLIRSPQYPPSHQ